MVSFYCSTINGFLQSTWGVSLPCCGSPPVIFRFTDFLKQIHFFKLSSWGRSRFPGSRPHLWSSVSPCPEEPLSQALVFTCRHNIPLEALQYWAGCKQPVPHFKCESHGWYGEKPLASVQCNMASLPLVRRPSPSGLFSQPFCSCCLISVDRSLPAAILFLTSSRFFPSLFSWCCSFGTNTVQHWLWDVHVRCDFSTAISEDSYMHFFSIPTRALVWSALDCSISCYFSSHAFFFLSASLLQRWKVLRHALKYFPLLNQSLCTCMQTH